MSCSLRVVWTRDSAPCEQRVGAVSFGCVARRKTVPVLQPRPRSRASGLCRVDRVGQDRPARPVPLFSQCCGGRWGAADGETFRCAQARHAAEEDTVEHGWVGTRDDRPAHSVPFLYQRRGSGVVADGETTRRARARHGLYVANGGSVGTRNTAPALAVPPLHQRFRHRARRNAGRPVVTDGKTTCRAQTRQTVQE
jgi:hypothetical protein